MADIKIAAVMRDGIFSPNHISGDAAILHDTAAEIRRRGFAVNIYSEREFVGSRIEEDIVLAMCRSQRAVEKLQRLEDEGRIVINSGYGIENCIRMFMIRLLRDSGVPIPDTIIVETDVDVRKILSDGGYISSWVKIADDHLHHLEDICRCRHAEEVQDLLHEFFLRGIRKAAVSKFIEGDRVRFYGVESIGWFHCFLPYGGNDALDEEVIDSLTEQARAICMKAARSLNVDVFGGDMVITKEGQYLIVNFDDWPSFAPIRKEAAKMIAKSVLNRTRKLISIRKRS